MLQMYLIPSCWKINIFQCPYTALAEGLNRVLEFQLSVNVADFSLHSYPLKFQLISRLSVNFVDLEAQLSVSKRVISQLTVKV